MLPCLAGCTGGLLCGAGGAAVGVWTYVKGQESAPPDAHHEYSITLDKSCGSKLGLKFKTDNADFVVIGFSQGLVTKWNEENPGKAVRQGDRVIQVNGVTGTRDQLLQACRANSKVLLIKFQRQGPAPAPKVEDDEAVVMQELQRTCSKVNDAKWFEDLIAAAWKKLEKYLFTVVSDLMGPLKASLPKALQGAVEFKDNFSIGESSPRFGPIKTRRRGEHAVVIDIGINMVTKIKLDIVVFGNVHLGIKELEALGTLSIALQPLDERPPFFGGVEVYFVNPPEINVKFCGAASLAELGVIKESVTNTIRDLLCSTMVIPARIAADVLEDDVDETDLRCPDPLGVLRITLDWGRNLRAADLTFMGSMTSDPYVRIELGQERWDSPTKTCTTSPTWEKDNVKDFLVYDLKQRPRIRAYDKDTLTKDDFLGSHMRTTVESLLVCTTHELSLTHKGSDAGSISIRTQWLRLENEEPAAGPSQGPTQLCISAKFFSASGLPQWCSAPFTAVVSVNGLTARTQPTRRSAWLDRPTKELQATVISLAEHMRRTRIGPGGDAEDYAKISEMTGLPACQVLNLVERAAAEKCKDPDQRAAMQRRLTADLEAQEKEMASRLPVFNETIRLLVPCTGSDSDAEIVLELQDEKGRRVGWMREPLLLRDILSRDDPLEGKWRLVPCTERRLNGMSSLDLHGAADIELKAKISYRWMHQDSGLGEQAMMTNGVKHKSWWHAPNAVASIKKLHIPWKRLRLVGLTHN